jgi:hypothetical protein
MFYDSFALTPRVGALCELKTACLKFFENIPVKYGCTRNHKNSFSAGKKVTMVHNGYDVIASSNFLSTEQAELIILIAAASTPLTKPAGISWSWFLLTPKCHVD